MRKVDLVAVGAGASTLSVAIDAKEAGLERLMVIDEGSTHSIDDLLAHPEIELRRGSVDRIVSAGQLVQLDLDEERILATTVVTAAPPAEPAPVHLQVPESLRGKVHAGRLPDGVWDRDVLVVGGGETAAATALDLAAASTRVVLARGSRPSSALSRLTRTSLLRREAERRITVLWRSAPVAIEDLEGELLVTFDTEGTPELIFDHVLFTDPVPAGGDPPQGPIFSIGDGAIPPGEAWELIRRVAFPGLPAAKPSPGRTSVEELRERHYNGTIIRFHRTHSDLWVVAVRPDHEDISHEAGQYASLGLGYWEPRADTARDPGLDRKWENLVRRSYSISSPIFDEHGYLADPTRSRELEFYVVLVPPAGDRVPALTPRLALRRQGDRIYVGPRIVGRYTLAPVTDPATTVVLLATGTGEAPHNAMIVELLRKGHHGPIVSVVSVRYHDDLAYLDAHRRLEERFGNYHYLPLVTRDPEVPKRYVQDVIRQDLLAAEFGVDLDPSSTHVFLCGNPAMIGIPAWDGDVPVFGEPVGACQLLYERGFDLDRHGHVGNVHTEKYW